MIELITTTQEDLIKRFGIDVLWAYSETGLKYPQNRKISFHFSRRKQKRTPFCWSSSNSYQLSQIRMPQSTRRSSRCLMAIIGIRYSRVKILRKF